MKAKLTYQEFLQLEGLLTLSRGHLRALLDIEQAALNLTEADRHGHVSDFVWSDEGAAIDLCRKAGITVEYPPHKPNNLEMHEA